MGDMMKNTIEFNLPEDREELQIALRAGEVISIVEETLNYIRQKLKYGELKQEATSELEAVRSMLAEALSY